MKTGQEDPHVIVEQETPACGAVGRRKAMSRFGLLVIAVAGCLCNRLIPPALGDTLQLRSGAALQGGLVSFDGQTIKFATDQGLQSIPRDQALVLTFAAPPSTAPASSGPRQATAPAAAGQAYSPGATPAVSPPPASGPVTIPAGTVLLVSTTSQVSSQSPEGQRFSANLASDLKVGQVLIAPAGTAVYGRVTKSGQAGRLVGKSTLQLALSEINLRGTMYPLMTTDFAEAGRSSFGKTVRNVGMGALVGGVFGDKDDARRGAAIGAGVSLLRKGDSVVVPPGAMLEFRMTQPLMITP